MQFGDLAPLVRETNRLLKEVVNGVSPDSCCVATLSGGTGNVPAGFKSVNINGTGEITFADGTTFTLLSGIPTVLTAPFGSVLPALSISGDATWYGFR